MIQIPYSGKLAKKLKTSEEPQYEGMCHLAIGRCEQNIGNIHGEAEALIAASKCYMEAEKRTFDLNLPTFEENLSSSIHSYNHAIRVLTENGDHMRAAGLAIELGDSLTNLNKPGEALTFYQRAAKLRPSNTQSYLFAQEKVAKTYVKIGDYHNALAIFTEMANIAEQISKKPAFSVNLDTLARSIEINLTLFEW